MKNQQLIKRSLFTGMAMLAFSISLLLVGPQAAKAQPPTIDINEIRGQKEAQTVKSFADTLSLFTNDVLRAATPKENAVFGAGLKSKAEKVRADVAAAFSNLEGLVSKLKSANRYNDQFDADVNTILGSNKVKSRVQKAGGARKFLSSGLNSTTTNNLKKDITTAAELVTVPKSEDVCRFVGLGIVAEALLLKKATTSNDKAYTTLGCDK